MILNRQRIAFFTVAVAVSVAQGIDKSVMSDKYWAIWNDAEQARIDADIEKNRKADASVEIAAPGVDDTSRKIQAVLVRNIYRAWFAHPKTMGITWWNTVDGAGVAGEPLVSGLFTREMEKKPAYDALDELINREWRTNLSVAADANGTVAFRGFRGRYRLSWTGADGKTATKLVEVK